MRRVERIRDELTRVPLLKDTHPSWMMVWDAVTEALGDIRDMRFLAMQANVNPSGKSPLSRPKYAFGVEAARPVEKPAERTVEGQRAAIEKFARGILDVLADMEPVGTGGPPSGYKRRGKPPWIALAEQADE